MEGKARTSVLTHFSLFPLALSGSEENLITDSRQVRLATGLFPVISLLNHSCSPNTSVSFISTVATVRASQQIRKGQEILHCYGPHKNRMGVAERRQKLRSQYFFDCNCPPCEREEQGPSQGPGREAFCCHRCRALLQGDDVLSCGSTSCTESVSRDHLVSQLQDLQQQVGIARKLLRNGELEGAIQLLLGCQHDAESFLLAEHGMVGEIEDDLAQAYAALGKGTGRSQPPIYRRVSEWLRFATGHPVLRWAMNSSNWPKSSSMGLSANSY
ncbi:SET and MYND domain-containing protein 4 isoform X4 [Physeter macrocephalus]|uniref:SET and MYND domain-containing protein 4 isoform X4 n=1 Tax=Physeter macrocephalus TaxID=9755 RepID=A0A455AVV7_PHYMC|nr:SET and MYND domain-containing protein 4 isoform X4 [Physeter catodon]|eukprot:XP_028340319.1 SET and MYND domain-containing protein 4 isoform X4 [Physeter catodon]